MPVPRKPVTVPFVSQQPPADLLEKGLRIDGRGLEEFRPVFLQTGVNTRANGSAYAEFENTKVMVAVYGPRQIERRQAWTLDKALLQCDYKVATFASKRRGTFGQSAEERDGASMLATALEGAVLLHKYPKSLIFVSVLVLQCGGSELAVAATAASAALADAGIEMCDLAIAANVCKVKKQLVLDANADECLQADGSMLLVMLPTHQETSQLVVTGEWSANEMTNALELAMGGCLQLDGLVRQCLKDSVAAKAKPS